MTTSWDASHPNTWGCEENQRQLYWAGHKDIVALTFVDPAHKDYARLVQDAVQNHTGRKIPLVYPRYDESLGRLRFEM
jgi:hypothetical protein